MTGNAESSLFRSLRLVVAALGGYAFAAGFVAIVATALPHAGMASSESATLGGMLGVLVYLAVILWVAASARPIRTASIVFALSAIMIGTAPMMAAG